MTIEHNPNYIHHTNPQTSSVMREVVFGMEDGMVSTLGAITGIAASVKDPFTVILAGFVIISVESISMAVGSYLSSKSEKEVDKRKLFEEEIELNKFPIEEKEELVEMYVEEGWPKDMAVQMSNIASQNKKLMLQEMAYRELKVIPDNLESPIKNALFMGFSYIVGGAIPLVPYLLFSISNSIPVSIIATLLGLIALGAITTKFTKRKWWKSGLEMASLASLAALIGFAIGQLVNNVWRINT